MPRPSHRAKILTEGLRVVHEHGFGGSSVRDIVQAAGVPQGSFTNHFASKEAFGLEIIEIQFVRIRELMRVTLCNDLLPPLERLRHYLDANIEQIKLNSTKNGCLFGNFAIEASDHSEAIRLRLVEIFAEMQRCIAYCLEAAVQSGELPPSSDCDKLARFILTSMQGAILLAKTQRDLAAIEGFKNLLFSMVLHQPVPN
jgi:TetR/AcrR family transcriptional repressor of nem operon